MRLYLAGERESATKKTRAVSAPGSQIGQAPLWVKFVRRRLFSYFYHGFKENNRTSKDVLASVDLGLDLFLDSGAFTAFTKKTTIQVEQFADYIKRSGKIWTVVSSLDHIGSGEESAIGSLINFQALVKLGLDVKPVFHVREDDKWLRRYIDEGHKYILIGGMVPESTAWLQERLDGLFDRYLTDKDGVPKVKLHGFGLTSIPLILHYPWHSVDSTSWLMTGVFGACQFFFEDGRALKVTFSRESPTATKLDGPFFGNMTKSEQRVIEQMLEPIGVTPGQLSEHYSYRDAVNAKSYQDDLERLGPSIFKRRARRLF
jgi:hypothetical protein